MVNDVSAGRHDPDMFAVVGDYAVPMVLMHMAGSPKTMQQDIHYKNLIEDIMAFFRESIRLARAAGIEEESIWLDPGIGFGKTRVHNLQLIKNLGHFKTLGRPLLIGPSRKSFIGAITGEPPDGRIFGTAASISAGILFGANMVRVHDVREMKQVAMLMDELMRVPLVS
jgi:dihydropteroate synthase